MTTSSSDAEYFLGNTDAEHERLTRQARHFDPFTERLFRDAGIGPGQRVLDLGSGAGDVAMLVARLVGPSGEVVGFERDPQTIARARARVKQAGLLNVTFTQSDVAQIPKSKPFDAAVGRFILMFVPDPVLVVRSLCALVRPGGVIAFLEPSWVPFFPLVAHLPLTFAAASLVHDTLKSSGADMEMGRTLYRIFQEAGLPPPSMHMETSLGQHEDLVAWIVDILHSLRPHIKAPSAPMQALGDLGNLPERLRAEIGASKTAAPWIMTVGAWSTTPGL